MLTAALSTAEGRLSRSNISRATMRKLYAFYVVNVFLVSIVAGSIFGGFPSPSFLAISLS